MARIGSAVPHAPTTYYDRRVRLRHLEPYLYLIPVLVSLAVFGYKIGLTLYESVLYHVIAYPQARRFVGLDNYLQILQDPMIWLSFRISLVWVIGTTIPPFLLGLVLALLLNQSFHGRGLYRTLVLSPWAISGVVSAMAWSWILNGPFGVLNDTLIQLGLITTRHPWLADPNTAMAGVLLASIWRGFPFFAITLLAGLQSIPKELYEAAEIDGADTWQRFWHITLPMLTGLIVLTTMLRAIWSFNFIENIFLMTYGGPANATTTWAFYLFQKFFDAGDIGYTAAMGIVLFVFLMLFAGFYLRLAKRFDLEAA
jgi:multiple sugar transport system permease protein